MADSADDTSLERTCSAACTKAGITALVFSTLALAVLPILKDVAALDALSTYAINRMLLKTAVEALDRDSCWRMITQSEPEMEGTAFAKLKERSCYMGVDGRLTVMPKTNPGPAAAAKAHPPQALGGEKKPPPDSTKRPAAPTVLGFGSFPQPLEEIDQALSVLGKRDTLSLAASVFPYRFGLLINRWERRAFDLSRDKARFSDKDYRFPEQFTLSDIRLLAHLYLPELSAVEQAITERARLTLPSAGSPFNLGSGTAFIELAILCALVYFWLYQREARLSATWPAPATLFAVFSRTTTSRHLFVLFTAVPACAAVLLARWSLAYVRAWTWALALAVVGLCVLIQRQTASRGAGWTCRSTEATRREP